MYSLFKRLGLDLKQFWPSLDFSQLIPMLIVVFNLNETNIDDDDEDDDDCGERMLSIMTTDCCSRDDDDDEEIKINEELLHIDQIRKHKNRLLSRLNLLRMESNRIGKDLLIFEKRIGQFIRQILMELDSNLSNKMDILCIDMVRIIRLIFSIQQQIKNIDSDHNNNDDDDDKQDEMKKHERLLQLNGQMNAAYNLCVAIQQRCSMFINRLIQRYCSSFDKITINHHHHHHHFDQWSSEQLFNRIKSMMTINDNNNVHHDDIVQQQQQDDDDDNDRILKIWLENQDQQQQTSNNMVNGNDGDCTDDDENNDKKKKIVWSFSHLVQSYLQHLESLNVQQQIIDSLIIYYQHQHQRQQQQYNHNHNLKS